MTGSGPALPRRKVAERQLTMRVAGDRRAAELLQLEIRRLARRLGLHVAAVRVRRVEGRAR